MNWKLILIVCLVFLSGCFDFEETLYLKQDGSGRGELHYAIPMQLMEMKGGLQLPKGGIPLTPEAMKEHFGSRKGIQLTGGSYREEGTLKIINVSLTFEDVRALSEKGMTFDWQVDNGDRVFRINLHRSGRQQINSPLRSIFMQNFETHGFRFNVYFPRKVSFANAQSLEGNTARWFVPLRWFAEGGNREKILEARFPMTLTERMKTWFSDLFSDGQ